MTEINQHKILFKTFGFLTLVAALTLTACLDGDSDSDKKQTGQFIDSAVQGVRFQTESQEGVTDEEGNYDYKAGEEVTFSIGNIVFPSALAVKTVTPLTLADSEDLDNRIVINIARLLQSLDSDQNPANGITIDVADDVTYALDFDQSVEDFETAVQDLMDDLSITLVSAEDAISHLAESLDIEPEDNGIVSDITISVSTPRNFFDFSSNTLTEADSETMDIGGTPNEGLNFGNEHMPSRVSERNLLLLAESGSLDDIPEVPEYVNAAPWVENSWDFSDGTGGQPVSVGELWVVYTVEGHYAVMEITATDAPNESFTFDYVYQSDGSRNF